MASIVRMPALAAGATEAAIQTWLVGVGDAVARGQAVVEIETEKAVVEFEAEEAGVVAALLVDAGASAAVGAPIAVLAAEGESAADAIARAGVDRAETSAPERAETSRPEEAPGPPPTTRARLFASPLVRRLARERGIDLATITGSGPHGRIVRRDIDGVPQRRETDAAPLPATPPPAGSTDIPHTGMRRAIARRLTESVTTVPHFFLTADCRVDELLSLRARINETTDATVSVNDLVLLAVAAAMTDVPEANAVWTPDAIRRFDTVDVGVAVAIPGGLVTPVVRGVERLGLRAVAAQVRDLAERARAGRLRQHELEGGSFAVSNLGMYGTKEFSAIINPPHSGILAVGAAGRRPVVGDDGALVAASVMTVTLSADHRVLDGALAARWLAAFVSRIESPLGLLV